MFEEIFEDIEIKKQKPPSGGPAAATPSENLAMKTLKSIYLSSCPDGSVEVRTRSERGGGWYLLRFGVDGYLRLAGGLEEQYTGFKVDKEGRLLIKEGSY